MIDIKINITNKIANAIGTPFIVCGNSDYTVTFTFDAEWGAYQDKTARFFFVSDGIEQYIDVLFSGNTCNAPVLPNIEKVLIGVYTGNLRTTTGAEVRCKRSILFGGKVHEPPTTEDVYNEILEIVSKKLGSEGGTVTGDYSYKGNTFIHEGNLNLLDNHIGETTALTSTASGKAITIESANAPLQQLKLYGKTTQNTTTGKNLIDDTNAQGVTLSSTETRINNIVGLTNISKGNYILSCVFADGTKSNDSVYLNVRNASGGVIASFRCGVPLEISVEVSAYSYDIYANSNQAGKIIKYVQLEKGSVATDYEQYTGGIPSPNPNYPQDLKSVGDSGSFEVGVYGKNLLAQQSYGTYIPCKLLKGTTYTVSISNTSSADMSLLFYDENKTRVAIIGISSVSNDRRYCSFSPIQDYSYVMFGWSSGTSVIDAMIELGTQVTEYEEYKGQTLTLTDTLRGVGEVADEIDFARGVTTQRFNVVDLGTLSWSAMGNCFQALPNPKVKPCDVQAKAPVLCSHYQIDTANNTWKGVNDKTISSNNNGFVHIVDKNYTDATTLKTALSGVYLVYPLAEPIETPLTETELNAYRHLMTNKGTTTILSEADMEVDYYINKPNAQAIGNIHSQLNKDYFKLQQAIISTGGN